MRSTFITVFTAVLLVTALVAGVSAQDIRSEYFLSLSDFYNVPFEDVTGVQEVGLSDEEIPVAFHVAQAADVPVLDVARMRAENTAWSDVASAFEVNLSSFYVLLSGTIESRKYRTIMDKFNSMPQSEWNSLTLSDDDIVNLVNLKFIYRYHDYSAFKVIAMREVGKTFVRINQQVKELRAEMIRKEMAQTSEEK